MNPVIDQFTVEYQRYHGISDGRAREQILEIGHLSDFAGKPIQDCTAADLRGYLSSLDHLHPNTVRKRLRLLTPFFTWAFENGEVTGEQLMAIRLVRAPKGSTHQGRPRPYSAKELHQFWLDLDARWPWPDVEKFSMYLDRFRENRSRYKRIKNAVLRSQAEAIFSLALECGMRRNEIFHASMDDIHYDNAVVVVPQRALVPNGKDHYREIPHTETSRRAIKAWMEMRARIKVRHKSPWIIGTVNKPNALAPATLKSFENIPAMIGDYEYHRFRHTAATLWLRSGIPIEQVQRLLGHAKLAQTLAYAEILTDDVRASVAKNEAAFARLTKRPDL